MTATDRVGMLRQFGSEAAELKENEKKSLWFAIGTFAAAYMSSQEAIKNDGKHN